MKTVTVKLGFTTFAKLTEQQQKTAIEDNFDINVDDSEWCRPICDAAKAVGINVEGFEVDLGGYCNLEFINDADYTAEQIIEQHSKTSDTFKNASDYLDDRSRLDIDEQDDELAELDNKFLKTLERDYLTLLRNEYDRQTTEEKIKETLSYCVFNADGTRIKPNTKFKLI